MELFEQQRVELVNIEDEIKVSYLDYAMSVIIGPQNSKHFFFS